jgi:hypothetical protein
MNEEGKDMKGGFGKALKCNSPLWEDMPGYCEILLPSAGQNH